MKRILFLLIALVSTGDILAQCNNGDTAQVNTVYGISTTTAVVTAAESSSGSGVQTSAYLTYVRVGHVDSVVASGSFINLTRYLTGLTAGTQYYYYYSTVCTSGIVRQHGPYYFTTLSSTVGYVPERPTVFTYLKVDTSLSFTPADTTVNRAPSNLAGIRYKSSNNTFYGYYPNCSCWKALAIDSAGIIALLNKKVDSVTVSGDSLFYWVHGVSHGYILPVSYAISALTAATATNSINNAAYTQAWNWNTLTGNALELKTNSTTASATQTMLSINMLGANTNAGQPTYGIQSINAHTGTGSTNYGISGVASSGTTNIGGYFSGTQYGLIVPASGGKAGIGTSTPAALLDVNGESVIHGITAGRGGNASDVYSTTFGYLANLSATGIQNTSVGSLVLNANTTGYQNTAIGQGSLLNNTTGYVNSAFGVDALSRNISGYGNVANGEDALFSNKSGNYNTGIGLGSLYQDSTGSHNTSVGYYAGYDSKTGSYNTFIGDSTGRSISTGSNNTIIGSRITGLAAGLNNRVVIANGAGNIRIYIDSIGNIGIGTTTPAASAKLDITSTTKGLLIPRLNTGQRNAISSPATGLMIWNTDNLDFEYYDGTTWQIIGYQFASVIGNGSGTTGNGNSVDLYGTLSHDAVINDDASYKFQIGSNSARSLLADFFNDSWGIGDLDGIYEGQKLTIGAGTLNIYGNSINIQRMNGNIWSVGDVDNNADKYMIKFDASAGSSYIYNNTSPGGVAGYVLTLADNASGLCTWQAKNSVIVGTTTNDNAASGNIGQYVESLIASGSATSLTTATAKNVTSISLTAGDWDVEGNINFSASTATVTGTSGGISSTSATVPTDGSEVFSGVQVTLLSENDGVSLTRKRFSLSGTTTIYLVGKCTFSAGSVSAFGKISARRVR